MDEGGAAGEQHGVLAAAAPAGEAADQLLEDDGADVMWSHEMHP